MNQDNPVAADAAATVSPERTAFQRGTPQAVGTSDTGANNSEAPSSGATGSGAPKRRRRRGGSGRGGGGSGGAARGSGAEAATETSAGNAAENAPRRAVPKAASRAKPAAARPDLSDAVEASIPGEGVPTSTAPKRRRSRGGRGRGSGTGAGARRETTSTSSKQARPVPDGDGDLGAGDEAPTDSTVDTQREDAMPDDGSRTSTGARRRRGRRGSGATKKATGIPGEPAAEPSAATPSRTRQRTRTRSTEEQVAAGGPTRGLRSSRSRTGRVGGGRRRREDDVIVPRITDKVMVITEHGDRDQIAVLEENILVQHYVTRTGATSMVGNVYLGRVQNVLPGMEAAFIDIGRGRNGVLYAGEVNYSPEDLEGPAPRIEQILANGQPVTVQVTKDPMGGKGARLTAQISMPGRFLVLVPNANVSGISRRLPDEERKRLKTIMRNVRPEGHGVIVRTAAEGASEEALTADLQRLVREWDDIQKRSKKAKAPAVLYEEPELTVRVVRDLFTDEEFKELSTDSPRVYEKVMTYVRDIAPDLEPKIHLHQGRLPVFEEFRIVEQIHKALDKKVWLPSGGYLFIERTEAMTIVDVNTGKSVGKTNLEATVTNTNLEGAREVARQLRLRDIGGIIVVDFIDMLLEKNKKQVEDAMKEALAADKTRSQVFEIGPLGLMQVTRKRVSGGLVESFSETCPTCEGRGILVNYEA